MVSPRDLFTLKIVRYDENNPHRISKCPSFCLAGESRGSESSSLAPGEVPGSPFYPGLSHPATLWKSTLHRAARLRGLLGRPASGRHRDGHRAAMGGR